MSEERMGETKERLEQIFRDYYQLIYRVAFSQVKNHADAEDITQEVFLKIIRHDMRYQSMEHERAWIVRVTINLCRDLLKSKWHKTSVSMEEVSEAQRGSCENFTEIQDDMMWAVLQLPEKYRNCLYLFYYEDYSIKEIARSMMIMRIFWKRIPAQRFTWQRQRRRRPTVMCLMRTTAILCLARKVPEFRKKFWSIMRKRVSVSR